MGEALKNPTAIALGLNHYIVLSDSYLSVRSVFGQRGRGADKRAER
jgi:hypothetical protein